MFQTLRIPRLAPISRTMRQFSTQQPASSALRIGFVPEHFSTPLEFAKKYYGLNARLLPFPSGTGHMVTALQSGEIDIGIGLTESWIAALGKAQTAKKDAGFRLVGTYVETPLCWAISTGAKREEVTAETLHHKKVGVSRIGSGSYVMSYVLADQKGWLNATNTAAKEEPFQVEVLNTFANLREAVNNGTADFFMWEHFTSKRYWDNGDIMRIGQILTPWSSWKIVAKNELLYPANWAAGGTTPAIKEELEDVLVKINSGVKHFEENQEEAISYISTKLDYSKEDAVSWLPTVEFTRDVRGVDAAVVKTTVSTLQKAGVLEAGVAEASMVGLERHSAK